MLDLSPPRKLTPDSSLPDVDIAAIEQALSVHGLLSRGWFNLAASARLPAPFDGCCSVVLVGNAGGSFWPTFSSWLQKHPGSDHPLDTWSKAVLEPIASAFEATAVFPSDGPPYMPFQQWAKAAEPVFDSPLKVLVHHSYGPWHAYRGALLFGRPIADVEPTVTASSPCRSCRDSPCLRTCPVNAFDGDNFAMQDCAAELSRQQVSGNAPCLDSGCIARKACPVGQNFYYPEAQMRFHTLAFLRSRKS